MNRPFVDCILSKDFNVYMNACIYEWSMSGLLCSCVDLLCAFVEGMRRFSLHMRAIPVVISEVRASEGV